MTIKEILTEHHQKNGDIYECLYEMIRYLDRKIDILDDKLETTAKRCNIFMPAILKADETTTNIIDDIKHDIADIKKRINFMEEDDDPHST